MKMITEIRRSSADDGLSIVDGVIDEERTSRSWFGDRIEGAIDELMRFVGEFGLGPKSPRLCAVNTLMGGVCDVSRVSSDGVREQLRTWLSAVSVSIAGCVRHDDAAGERETGIEVSASRDALGHLVFSARSRYGEGPAYALTFCELAG